LRKILSGRSLPAVTIAVSEQHVGVRGLDPAAETELIRIWRELGGEVIDPQRGDRARARYHLMGEGISAFGIRQKGVISVKARLEIRVLDGAGQVVAGDTQTSVKLGLSEVIAGKEALADAAGAIAQRLLPQLVNGK